MRVAAIGIGSNSLRMLLADVENDRLIRIERFREGLRVFAALDSQKRISSEMIQRACESVRAYCAEAKGRGATALHLFATSAVRDASNQEELISALQNASGLELDICSGEEEACLSFLGATDGGAAALIDIGGGSTEIALGCGQDISDACSLQMGAVRLQRNFPIQNCADAWQVVEAAAQIIRPVKERFANQFDRNWTGVGGTFTSCAAVVQNISWERRDKIHRFQLTEEAVEEAMVRLSSLTLDERLQLACLQPQRADIVVHGIAILLACMKNLGISSITVSECGNLEGYLKRKYLF